MALLAGALSAAASTAAAEPAPLEVQRYHRELGEGDAESLAPAEAGTITLLAITYLGARRPLDAIRLARVAERLIDRGIAASRERGDSTATIAAEQENLAQVRKLIVVAEADLGRTEAAYDGSLENAIEVALGERDPGLKLAALSDVAYVALVTGDFGVARSFAKASLDAIEKENPYTPFHIYPPDTPELKAAVEKCEELADQQSASPVPVGSLPYPSPECEQLMRASHGALLLRGLHDKVASNYADAILAIDPSKSAYEALDRQIQIEARYGVSTAAAELKFGYLVRSLGFADAAKGHFEKARAQAKRDLGLAPLDSYAGQVSSLGEVFGPANESGTLSSQLLLAGETELAAGRAGVALTFLDPANAGIQATIASAGLTGARTRYLTGLAKLQLGQTEAAVGDLSAASELYDGYTPTSRDLRRLGSGRFDTAIDVHLALLQAARTLGNADLEGIAAARAARAGIARSSGAALVRLQSGKASLAVRAAQDAARAATAAEDRLQEAIAAQAPSSKIKTAAERVAATRRRARDTLDAVLAERPELRLFGIGAAATGSEMQNRLRRGEAILMFAIGRDRAYTVVITPDGLTAEPIREARGRLQHLVTTIANSCRFVRRGGRYTTVPFARAESAELFRALIGPVKAQLAGTQRIYLARNGVLDGLSFNTLYDDENKSWFGDRFAFSVVPDPSRVGAQSQRSGSATAGVLGVGDPAIGDAGWLRDLYIDGAVPARLEPTLTPRAQLAGARQELSAVFEAWPSPRSKLLVGAEATEQSFRRAPPGSFKVLAFATHAITANPEHRQPTPALVFTPGPPHSRPDNDGLLHPSEIEDLSVRSDLVLLSACETAAGSGLPNAEALSGLAQAFLYAGAKSVAATHWKVDSASAADLIERAMAAQSGGRAVSTAAAFQAAAKGVRASPGKSHPAFWAPFVVVETGER